MKAFWKVLGFAALVAGLAPYKVDKNEETGESSYQALLWRGSIKPGEDGEKREVLVNFGEGTLPSKVLDAVEKKKEAHLFSDELSVDYHGTDEEGAFEEDAADAAEEDSAIMEEASAVEDVVEDVVEDAAETAEDVVDAAEKAVEDAADAVEEATAAVEDAAAE